MLGGLSEFRAAANLDRRLRTIPPGRAMIVSVYELCDMVVPASQLDRQTPEYLVEWLRSRLPFRCVVTPDLPLMPSKWTFYRPKEDEYAGKS